MQQVALYPGEDKPSHHRMSRMGLEPYLGKPFQLTFLCLLYCSVGVGDAPVFLKLFAQLQFVTSDKYKKLIQMHMHLLAWFSFGGGLG